MHLKRLLGAVLAIAVLGGLAWLLSSWNPGGVDSAGAGSNSSNNTVAPVPVLPISDTNSSLSATPTSQDTSVRQKIDGVLDRLFAATNKEEIEKLLRELRALMQGMAPGERTAFVNAFFASGKNRDLPFRFQVGEGGFLEGAPTLRVWLADAYGTMDPAGAAAFARGVLETSESADEWAISLRSVARGDDSPSGKKLLKDKTLELMRNTNWVANPSSGFLHAFDVAVHLKDPSFAKPISGLLRQTNTHATAHAAFLALDRMTLRQPKDILGVLQLDNSLLEGREEVRAGYFARGDLRDPTQKELLAQYLLDANRSDAELKQFAGLFPNANQLVSKNLLTEQTFVDGYNLSKQDKASLQVIREWLKDERFQSRTNVLRAMERRLAEFVRQAAAQKPN